MILIASAGRMQRGVASNRWLRENDARAVLRHDQNLKSAASNQNGLGV